MLKAYKTEINPSEEQKIKIHKTIGTCRYVYNLFIEKNKEQYDKGLSFLSGYDFSKWLNNTYTKQEDFKWIKKVSTKAVKQSIMNGDKAFKRFFKKQSSFPKFKKKSDYGSFYLIGTIHVKRHLIQLPTLGKVRLKEKGYIPFDRVKSATVSREGSRYYVSALVEEDKMTQEQIKQSEEGLGIDIGIKEFLFTSNGESIANISKTDKLVKLNKSLKRHQRFLSRKKKGSNNWYKQKIKLQNLHRRIKNIKTDLKRKLALRIVKRKPQYITIENLNVKGMMKNKKLSNSFQQIGIRYFFNWLKYKCVEHNIELRQVDRFYPSSQICSDCGSRKPMPLHLRMYNCESCGLEIDRDLNASINLKQSKKYTVLV